MKKEIVKAQVEILNELLKRCTALELETATGVYSELQQLIGEIK